MNTAIFTELEADGTHRKKRSFSLVADGDQLAIKTPRKDVALEGDRQKLISTPSLWVLHSKGGFDLSGAGTEQAGIASWLLGKSSETPPQFIVLNPVAEKGKEAPCGLIKTPDGSSRLILFDADDPKAGAARPVQCTQFEWTGPNQSLRKGEVPMIVGPDSFFWAGGSAYLLISSALPALFDGDRSFIAFRVVLTNDVVSCMVETSEDVAFLGGSLDGATFDGFFAVTGNDGTIMFRPERRNSRPSHTVRLAAVGTSSPTIARE